MGGGVEALRLHVPTFAHDLNDILGGQNGQVLLLYHVEYKRLGCFGKRPQAKPTVLLESDTGLGRYAIYGRAHRLNVYRIQFRLFRSTELRNTKPSPHNQLRKQEPH